MKQPQEQRVLEQNELLIKLHVTVVQRRKETEELKKAVQSSTKTTYSKSLEKMLDEMSVLDVHLEKKFFMRAAELANVTYAPLNGPKKVESNVSKES